MQLPQKQPFFKPFRMGTHSVFKRYSIYYSTIPLAALLVYVVFRAVPAAFSDFANYYFGSLEIWQGHIHTAYDPAALNLSIAQKGYTGIFGAYTTFPPFTALVVAPLLLLPVGIAKIVFNVLSAALFVFTLIRTVKFFKIPAWVLLVTPVIFLVPIRNNIFFGQSYLLVTVLLLEGFMAYKKDRHLLAAVLWSVAILFKLFPVCILFFLLARKQYRVAGYCIGISLLLVLLSILCTGWEAWRLYVFTLLPRLNNGEINDSYTYMFQSAQVLLKHVFVYDPVQNPDVVHDHAAMFVVTVACYKAMVLAGCIGITVQKKTSDFMAFGVWIMASLLIPAYGSTYSLILLLIPLLAWDRKWLVPAMLILFIICNLPVQWFADRPLLLQYPRLYLLLLFFIMILVLTKTTLPYKVALAFAGLLVVADAGKLFPVHDNSRYLLTKSPLLIYDYTIQQNKLVYYYWDSKGSHAVVSGIQAHAVQNLPVQNNQLYYRGKQLTYTADQKKKAVLINGNQIIYLSDKNRGVGFFTLRTISPG